jgi:hypothetical protein
MTDEEIFDLAETHGWQDDFGRWNFKDDGLIKFALAIKTAEWVGLTDEERETATGWSVEHIEAKLKEKNGG